MVAAVAVGSGRCSRSCHHRPLHIMPQEFVLLMLCMGLQSRLAAMQGAGSAPTVPCRFEAWHVLGSFAMCCACHLAPFGCAGD